MKIAARRRLALGVLGTTSAVVAGLLVGPALAAANGLTISPSAAPNTAARVLTFSTTDADLRYGGTATFTRLQRAGEPAAPAVSSFTVDVAAASVLATASRQSTGTAQLADGGSGLGTDGPANAGTYAVTVVGDGPPLPGAPGGGGEDSCPSCFTVLPGADLVVDSVAPNSLRPGTSAAPRTGDVSILGEGFERGTRVEVLFPSGAVDSAISADNAPSTGADGITTSTELQRQLRVGATPAGARDVRVTNADGSTSLCEDCFFVAGPALTSVNPSGAFNDPTQALTTLTFSSDQPIADGQARLEFVGDPGAVSRSALAIEGTQERDYSGTSITATFDLRNAAPGDNAYQPVVEGANGIVNACDACRFTVSQRGTPTLTSLDRSTLSGVQKELAAGETAEFTASGTNLSEGATLVFTEPEGLTVTGVDVVSPERAVFTLAAAADAVAGDRDVEVLLTDGKTSAPCTGCLTVTPGSGATPSPTASPGPGNAAFALDRFAGADRYATAALLATGSYDTAATVLLANGQSDDPSTARDEDHFPDALAGAYLAGFRAGPTLLATETALPAATRDALVELEAENVVILGGTSAISQDVQDQLAADGYTVTRLGGTSRYDTAAAIATAPPVDYVGEDASGRRTAVVASGEGFADALVAGPLGYEAKFPVLITAKAGLSPQTADALEALEIENVLIPGGTAAVSAETEAQIKALGITVRRFAGQNRSETATLVAAYAYDSLGFDRTHVELALGLRFPDALAGGPHAGLERAPILLTASVDSLGAATEAFLRNRAGALQDGDILGGTSAVSQAAEDQAERAVREGGAASPSPSASAGSTATASGSASPSPTASPSGGTLPFPL